MKNDAFEQHGSVKLGSASSGGWDYSHAKRASVDRRILVVAFLLLMTCLLFWVFKSQSQPGDSTLPFAHRYTAQGHLLAIDLDHGAGSERAAVQRTWAGQETLDQHFGLGWCDLNHVRVLQVSKERVAVLRGGVGWQMGQLKGDTFVCRSGDKIRKTVSGWTLTASSGQILQFDAQGRLGSSTDASGTRWVYGYDAQSRLVSLSGGPENMLLYHYDPVRDRVVRVEGPEGLRLEYAYDAGGRLTTVVNDRKIKITYEYDKRGELSGLKDTFGRHAALAVLATQPAPDHTTKSKAKPFLEALLFESHPAKKTMDAQGRIAEREADGRKTAYTYDTKGQVESVASAEGRSTMGYDRFGRLASITGPDGTTIQMEYNNLNQPVRTVLPDGSEIKETYNEHGFLVREQKSASDWTTYEYDTQGRLGVLRRAPAYEERYSYNERSRLARVLYSGGREVRYAYDSAGRKIGEEWSTGERRRWAYDNAGRLASSVNAAGLKVRYVYDADGGLSEIEDVVHGKTVIKDKGMQWSVDKGELGRTDYVMLPSQLPATITTGPGRQTLFQYNPRGKLQSVITPSGQVWRYARDGADRMTEISAPSGAKTVLARDQVGRLQVVTRSGIPWRQYQYDKVGRLIEERSAAGLAMSYQYDAAGRVQAKRLPDGAVTFSSDASGVCETVQGPDYQLEEQLYEDGSLARRDYKPAQMTLVLPRDKQGRPAGIELDGLKANYGYDKRGALEQITLPDGRVIHIARDQAARPVRLSFADSLSLNLAYDGADRITAVEAASKIEKSVLKDRYTYDLAGNLVSIQSGSGVPRRLAYDAENRLTKAPFGPSDLSFGYDTDNNLRRLTSTKGAVKWLLSPRGQVTRCGPLVYAWDDGGNLLLTATRSARTENIFDPASRLKRRTIGTAQWRYGYLHNGDRLWREGPEGKTWYAYVQQGLAGFKDEKGQIWLIVRLPGTDLPLALCGPNGQTYFVVADRLNSVRRLVDPAGNVIASADYGPFGIPEAIKGDQKFAEYAGMLVDAGGLYYARQRYYDPALARFISIDPLIGTPNHPATLNAYAYAGNNPYRYRDPFGTTLGSFDSYDNLPLPLNGDPLLEPWSPLTRWFVEDGGLHPYHLEEDKALWFNETGHLTPDEELEIRKVQKLYRQLDKTADVHRGAEMQARVAEARSQLQQRLAQINDRGSQRYFQSIAEGPSWAQSGQSVSGAGVEEAAQSGSRIPARSSGTLDVPIAAAQGPKKPWTQTINMRAEAIDDGSKAMGGAVAENRSASAAGEVAESTGRAVGEVAEGLGTKLARWGGRGLRAGGKLLGVVGDAWAAWDIGTAIGEGENVLDADNAEITARAQTKAVFDQIREHIRTNSVALLPRPDGSHWNPKNPQDMAFLMNDVALNLNGNKRPLDGIMMDPAVMPPEQQAKLQAAIQQAAELANRADSLHQNIERAKKASDDYEAKATSRINEIHGSLQFMQMFGGADPTTDLQVMEAFGGQFPVDAIRSQIAAVQAATANLSAIDPAFDKAVQDAVAANDKAAGYAGQKLTIAQATVARQEVQGLITIAEASLNAAEGYANGAVQLSDTRNQLKGLVDMLGASTEEMRADISSLKKSVTESLNEVENDMKAAAQERAPINGWCTKIDDIIAQMKSILQPFGWNPDAAAALREISCYESTDERGRLYNMQNATFDPIPSNCRKILDFEKYLEKIAGIAGLLAESEKALTAFENALPQGCESKEAAADAALAAARDLLALIGGTAAAQNAGATAPPSPLQLAGLDPASQTPAGPTGPASLAKVEVPSVTRMTVKAACELLASRGLKPSIQLQGDAPKSANETRVVAQTPDAGTMIWNTNLVFITIMQEEARPGTTVPNVVGLPADQAYSKLDAAGLVADSVYLDDKPPTPKQVGTVKSQAPVATTTNPNTRTQAGDVVHLEIYGKVVPSLLNWHQNKFDLILKPVGMSVDSTTVDKLAPREDLELCAYGQSPAPGSLVPRNKKMSVKLYRPRDSNANYPGKTAPVAAPTRKGKKPGDEFIGEWKMISIHQYLPLPEKEISAQGSIDKCDRMGTAGLYWQLEGCGFGGGDMNPEDGSTYATRHGVKTWGEKWCFSIEPGHARYEGRQPEIDTQNNLGKKLTYRRVVKYRRVGTGSGSSKDGLAGIDSGVAATGTQAGGTIDYPDMSLGRSFRSQDVVVAGDEMTVTYDETGYGRDSFVEVPIHQDAVGSWVDEGWDPWLVFHVDKNKKISGMFQRWQNQAHTGILDEQFIDLPSFVSKLKQPPDPVSRYLQSQLCNESLTYLRDMAPNNADLQRRLLFDLDGIVHRQPIYDAQRFAGVTLRPETQLLLAKFLGNESRATINKMLLEDAYPREISTNSSNFIVPFTGEAHTVGTSEKNKNTSFKIAGVLPAREKNGQPGTWELEEFFNQSDKRFDGKIHIHEIRNGKLETIKEYRTMHRFDGAK